MKIRTVTAIMGIAATMAFGGCSSDTTASPDGLPARNGSCSTSVTLSILSFVVTLQTYGFEVFDRYSWPPLLGLAIAIATLAGTAAATSKRRILLATLSSLNRLFGWSSELRLELLNTR